MIRVLKQAGLVTSVRGPKGGHVIAKHPAEILGQLVRLFEGQSELVVCRPVALPKKPCGINSHSPSEINAFPHSASRYWDAEAKASSAISESGQSENVAVAVSIARQTWVTLLPLTVTTA